MCKNNMWTLLPDSLIDEDTAEVLCGVTETAEDTMVVTVPVKRDTCNNNVCMLVGLSLYVLD